MRKLLAALLFFALTLAEDLSQNPYVIVINQTHVLHTPIPMTETVGSLGIQGLGGIDLGLNTHGELGGFVEYQEWRGRMAARGSLGINGGEICYTGVLDWLGYTYEVKTTYRIRFGGGGGFQFCYPIGKEEDFELLPLVEGVANLQLRVLPNVIADVSLMAGFPQGVGGAVGFAFAY